MAEQKKTSGFKPTLQKAKAKFFKTYYSNPAKDLKIIAVTGTSGRDITANYLQNIIKARDEKVGLVIDPKTTSELYRKLFKIWKTGTDYVIVSIDSAALANHLFYGMPIHVNVITDNISEDAKDILFNTTPDYSIINRDDENYDTYAAYPGKTATLSYGHHHSADLKVIPGKLYKHGAEATIVHGSERFEVATYLTDDQVAFYMAAAALAAFALDFNSDQIVDGIADYEPDAPKEEPKQEEEKPVL